TLRMKRRNSFRQFRVAAITPLLTYGSIYRMNDHFKQPFQVFGICPGVHSGVCLFSFRSLLLYRTRPFAPAAHVYGTKEGQRLDTDRSYCHEVPHP
ncbi:hypothetical protein BGW80DRAFT_1307286, partial [Lactifluus volemus]